MQFLYSIGESCLLRHASSMPANNKINQCALSSIRQTYNSYMHRTFALKPLRLNLQTLTQFSSPLTRGTRNQHVWPNACFLQLFSHKDRINQINLINHV